MREEGRGLLELKGERLELVADGARFAHERLYVIAADPRAPGELRLVSRERGLYRSR